MSRATLARSHYSRPALCFRQHTTTDSSSAISPGMLPVPLVRQLGSPLTDIAGVEQLLAQLQNARARGVF